jgi:hypothetical protein
MSSTTISPSDLAYYNQLMSAASESSEKLNVLKNLIPFVLDNSIRESTVGQLRGHTVEDKNAILTALKEILLRRPRGLSTSSLLPSMILNPLNRYG